MEIILIKYKTYFTLLVLLAMSKVFSFSVKNEDERKFVEEIKKQYDLQGRKFSWIVLQALKDYEQKRSSNVKPK